MPVSFLVVEVSVYSPLTTESGGEGGMTPWQRLGHVKVVFGFLFFVAQLFIYIWFQNDAELKQGSLQTCVRARVRKQLGPLGFDNAL